jgi:hypothetical protein
MTARQLADAAEGELEAALIALEDAKLRVEEARRAANVADRNALREELLANKEPQA